MSDRTMLDDFFELRYQCVNVRAKEILYNYAATKGNSISEIVALLFQIPGRTLEDTVGFAARHLMGITEFTIGKMIAEVDNRSIKSATMSEVWVALQPFNQPTAIELYDLFNELCNCINEVLIVDLIKLIYEYL